MTVTGPTQTNQPAPQQETPVDLAMKALVQRLPATLRDEMSLINGQELTERQRADAIADLAARAKPVIDGNVQAVRDRKSAADAEVQRILAAKEAVADRDNYIPIRDRHHDKWSHADSPVNAVQDSIASTKGDELAVVLQEARVWLENRGHPADFIPSALARSDDEMNAATAVQERARQSEVMAETTGALIEKRIKTGDVPSVFVPWGDAMRAKYDPDFL